jgi:DNA-binding CsgD family transcriptional regulator
VLEPLAVSAEAEMLYRLLVAGPLPPEALQAHSRLGPQATRRHLAELAIRDLVARDADGRYRARPADHLLAAAQRRTRADRNRAAQSGRCTLAHITNLIADVCHRPDSPAVTRLPSYSAVLAGLAHLAEHVKVEQLGCSTVLGPTATRRFLADSPRFIRVNNKYLSRGCSGRGLLPEDQYDSCADQRGFYDLEIAQGEALALTALIPPQFQVFDRQVAILPLAPRPGSSGGAVIVRDAQVADMLARLYDDLWAGSTPLKPSGARRRQLTAPQRAILGSLANGKGDDVIARELGRSRRTIAGEVATLMTISGASSRFQLGVHAVAEGWLDAPRYTHAPMPRPRRAADDEEARATTPRTPRPSRSRPAS